jgi:hypothetical protein
MYVYLNAWILKLHLDVSVCAFGLRGRFRGMDGGFLGSTKALSYDAPLTPMTNTPAYFLDKRGV